MISRNETQIDKVTLLVEALQTVFQERNFVILYLTSHFIKEVEPSLTIFINVGIPFTLHLVSDSLHFLMQQH